MTSSIDPLLAADVASLAARLARPVRPRVAETRAAVGDAESGPLAWRRLFEHGLLPAGLLRSPERLFAVVDTERRPAAAGSDALDLREAPSTVDAAIALGSDAAAVLESEQLARLLRVRLGPWGASSVQRIEWVVVTHQIPYSFRQGSAFNCALYSLEHALEAIDVEFRTLRPDAPGIPPFVADVIAADKGWEIAVDQQLEVPGAFNPPAGLAGVPFDTLDNPFAITLQVWTSGYVLDHLHEDDRASVRLFTSVIDAPQNLPARLRDQARSPDA